MGNKFKALFIFIITIALFLGFTSQGFANYYDDEITKVDNRNKEINDRVKVLEDSILKIKNNKQNVESELEKLNAEFIRLTNVIRETEKRVISKEEELSKVRESLVKTYEEISILEKELKKREVEFRQRVKSLHKGEKVSVIDVVVSSDSLGDMLSRLFSYKVIVKEDNRVIEEYLVLSEKLAKKKKESEELVSKLETHLKELQDIQQKLSSDKKKVEDIQKDKELKSKGLDVQLNEMLTERKTLLNEKEESEKVKLNLEKEKLEFLEEQRLWNTTVYSVEDLSGITHFDINVENEISEGKLFVTPAKGRFTSPFGPRWGKFHFGIDIASPVGTPIIASASGVVTKTESHRTYGNVIMVKHVLNDVVYMTVYAHLDSFGVRVGDSVEQGQVIALMGNTGRSTGPHLHFEIHEGGVWGSDNKFVVNPMKFLK